MEFNNQDVWIGADDLNKEQTFIQIANQEFADSDSLVESLASENAAGFTTNRRDFLKYLGFGVGAATLAASCEIPVKRAIPFVVKPDTIVPGVANYYASSYMQGGDYVSILVKTREGRPIKIEGNSLSKVTKGGTSARSQALVLGLYDTNRIQNAGSIKDGKITKMTWADLDKAVGGKINATSQIRIVTHTILSPMTKSAIADFTAKYPNTKVVTYDSVSAAALLDATEQCYGVRAVPNYRFDEADYIVSFGADFLGTWISPTEYSNQYSAKRKVKNPEGAKMSRHVQVESFMSLTGSNADTRILVKPSEMGAAITTLYNEVMAKTDGAAVASQKVNDKAAKMLKKLAAELVEARGKSLIVCGTNNVGEQTLVHGINSALGNVGNIVDFGTVSYQRQGSDAAVQGLIQEMNSGAVNAVFVMDGTNPVFELPNGDAFKAALSKVGVSVSFAGLIDETTAACQYVAPTNHLLESWGDAEPKSGHYSLVQPTIAPLFETRQTEESLLLWSGVSTNMHDYLASTWEKNQFKQQRDFALFQSFWDSTLHDGVLTIEKGAVAATLRGDMNAAAAAVTKTVAGDKLEISFYETINIGGGEFANNPWLQEMPDPVMRTVWGNYLAVPVEWDGVNNINGFKDLKDGDKVEVTVNGKKLTCIVVRQFGQPNGTLAIGVGYGRTVSGLSGTGTGTYVQNALKVENGYVQSFATGVEMSGKVGVDADFAAVQYHHTMGVTAMGKEENKSINVDEKSLGYKGFQGSLTNRSVINRTDMKELKTFVSELEEKRKEFQELNSYTLYRGHEASYKRGHHWGLHVDLNACTGCGACTVACMSENNVPVVGKKEVHRHHEMTWLRIDRYYFGDFENPNTVYQPMMCQHCDNAPCENVCPVNATSHSGEGLNQMTYNRCIGTRYCANNCPYKVRRFNWLDYTTADLFGWNERSLNGETELPYGADNLTRMVLNPDVTVRSRGVIEKCSFCVQRIQEGKLVAKKEGRQLRDGDVKPACVTSCPTGGLIFGDKNNPETEISKELKENKLNYIVLEETNVGSNVTYSTKVTNKLEA